MTEFCRSCGNPVVEHYDEDGYTPCLASVLNTMLAGEWLKDKGLKEDNR